MGIILALVAFFLCVIIYVRMVRRETPEPLGKIKAAIPVVVGLAAPFLATALVILFGWLMKVTIGIPLAGLSDSLVYKSLVTSFVGAGFTEEFVKCMLLLLVVKILKPKNVYEYGIFCAGIAVGFTLLEELLYGNGNTVTACRFWRYHGHSAGYCALQKAEQSRRSRQVYFPRRVSAYAVAHPL